MSYILNITINCEDCGREIQEVKIDLDQFSEDLFIAKYPAICERCDDKRIQEEWKNRERL